MQAQQTRPGLGWVGLLALSLVFTLSADIGGRRTHLYAPDSGHLASVSETQAGESAPAQEAVPRFEPSDCPFQVPAGAAVECGYLVVPEDRGQPDGRTIRLAVAILKSRSDNPAPDPVVYLAGGPGASALRGVGGWLDTPFLESRDFILLDQRGAGYSEPALNCPEIDEAVWHTFGLALSAEDEIALEVEAAIKCRDRLVNEGVNLAAYNSAASAADLNDLRRVLGYREWNLYGISYGTRLALTAMRDYPGGVRSVILDSTYPPRVGTYIEMVPNAAHAFDVLFAGCAADPACNAAYPELKTMFYGLLNRMNANPIPITVPRPGTGEPVDLLITGDDMAGGVFSSLYSARMIPFIPLFVHQLAEGNYELLPPLAEEKLPDGGGEGVGMSYSVLCYEEAPFDDSEAIKAAIENYPQLRGFLPFRSERSICEIWGAGKATPVETEPVSSDIPTLILAGEYDPITPPYWGETAAETLSQSFFYEFPGLGHAVTNSDCPRSIAAAFLDDPNTAPDASCSARMSNPDFFTEDDLYLTPAIYRLYVELLAKRDLFQFGLLGFCLLFFLAEVALWLLGLLHILRRRAAPTTRAAQLARWLAGLTVTLNLAFLVALVSVVRNVAASNWIILMFGLPSAAAPLFVIPPLAAVLTFGLPVFTVLAWKHGYWTVMGRVHYSLLTLAALAFIWFLQYWGLLTLGH
jgi:pimeloyl-ACP methyl ester carboxylesterase